MHATSFSLLERLREPDDHAAWARFVRLYTPLLLHWGRRAGLQPDDAADLVQDVFALLLVKLPAFRHDGVRNFRSWLRTVTLNKWRERVRRVALPVAAGTAALAEVADPGPPEEFWEVEYREGLVAEALRLLRSEFDATTWRAYWEYVVGERSAQEVGDELGLTAGAVRAAKFRILGRLRREMAGLLD